MHKLAVFCILMLMALKGGPGMADITSLPIANHLFAEGMSEQGVPLGWSLYAGGGENQSLAMVTDEEGNSALLIDDGDGETEIGITQSIPVEPGLVYEAAVEVKIPEDGTGIGAFMQMRFLPSNEFVQTSLDANRLGIFERIALRGTAPPDTQNIVLYLYTHRAPTPKLLVRNVELLSGVEPPAPEAPPVHELIPPQYDRLKDLYLETPLVSGGQARISIVAPASGLYGDDARALAAAVLELTGVAVPVVDDTSTAAAMPLEGHLVCLGNRSTNRAVSDLYDLYYSLTDLKYPGPGGYEVRTLHNPFGNGYNVIFAGGSDAAGVRSAVEALVGHLREAGARPGELTVGRLMDIRLGEGLTPPRDVREMRTWEDSLGYGSTGYFGWTSISKHMAMYYMTGDAHHAREFVRLAFPDAQALSEIDAIDQERIENKNDPLAGPYHYNAHMMILFWDLIEESPVFTDEERLRITNAFSRQLDHRKNEGVYALKSTPAVVGSRHGQWSAISLYCLGRYFEKYYPDPIWTQSVYGSIMHFRPLHHHAWVIGEFDNLFWYSTGIAPIFTYMVLTGDRVPLENGVLDELLRGQEILLSGSAQDNHLRSAALDFLQKAAYITADGRWLYYRERTGMDTDGLRLGQSYWAGEELITDKPTDLNGIWSIQYVPRPQWRSRNSGLPFEQSFLFGSFRTAVDSSGDYLLIDGFNGASRNPYHTFALLQLRINGRTLLSGFGNQVLTKADGMVEPEVAMDAALTYHDVLGETVMAVGEVPKMAYSNWRRALVHRIGSYTLVTDELTFRTNSDNMKVETQWQPVGGTWQAAQNKLTVRGSGHLSTPPGWLSFTALEAPFSSFPDSAESIVRLATHDTLLLRGMEIGHWLEMEFDLENAVRGEVFAHMLNYTDRGTVRFLLDGEPVGEEFNHYANAVVRTTAGLGVHSLAAGTHRLRVEVTGLNPDGDRGLIGLVGVAIRPEGSPAQEMQQVFELHPADVLHGQPGTVTSLSWTGAVRAGEQKRFFNLLAAAPGDDHAVVSCLRVNENAAVLQLPEPALAVMGAFADSEGDLVVTAADHLYGHNFTAAGIDGKLLSASQPVNASWEFATGVLTVECAEAVELTLAVAADANLRTGETVLESRAAADGRTALVSLPAGRHEIRGARPHQDVTAAQTARLEALLQQGRQQRTAQLAADAERPVLDAPQVAPVFDFQADGPITDIITVPTDQGLLIGAAHGNTLSLLSTDGQLVHTIETEGEIRVLRWWEEHRLLLVGCRDEKVIAYDTDWQKRWEFVSVMDQAVYEAAKQYWFKSAPGHEGIHGLHTGEFLDGKSQCFVGSACTLEIIDENGQLVRRLPVFWGPGWKMRLIDGPDDSINLLIARWPNGTDQLSIINNRDLQVRRGFYGVPAGHTMVSGWSAQNRTGLEYVDLAGDGQMRLVTAINGTWNRVTVYSADDKPLANAAFGPGISTPRSMVRDMAVGDLNGDGVMEIAVGLAEGLVLVLDHECNPVWSRMMSQPPMSLVTATPPGETAARLVVGNVDGSVVVLDGGGTTVGQSAVTGRPIHALVIPTEDPLVIWGTDKGHITGLSFTR